jgi:hypothetical protein
MTDDVFTDTDESTEDEAWVDVRMTDPEAGEWDIDVVVAGGRVEFVDLRIEPSLLAGFIDCLVDDLAQTRAQEVLAEAAERRGLDPEAFTAEE